MRRSRANPSLAGGNVASREPQDDTESAVQRLLDLEPSKAHPLGASPRESDSTHWRCNTHGDEWDRDEFGCLSCMEDWEEIEAEDA